MSALLKKVASFRPAQKLRSSVGLLGSGSVSDESQDALLARLGLQPQFKRDFDFLVSFGISFCIISPLTGIGAGLSTAWNNSGPAAAIYGWKLVSLFSLFIGLSMAEIVSGLPSAGGPYFWSSWLGGRHSPFLSWITGWFNLMGQVATTASVAASGMFVLVNILQLLCKITLTQPEQLAVYLGILLVSGAVNSCPSTWLGQSIAFGTFINIAGVIFVVLLLTSVAPWHQPAKFVWATFFGKDMSPNNAPNDVYLFCQGCLMSTFVFLGYDSCGHISEETRGADSSAPYAIVSSIVVSAVVGYVLLLGLLFSIQDPSILTSLDSEAQGYAPGQLMWDVFKARYGRGDFCAIPLSIFFLACVMCTISSLTANSRMIFAFARDNGIPFSSFFRTVSTRMHSPIRSLWLSVAIAFALGLPLLVSTVAFTAVVSIASIGLQVSYGIPILCRLTYSRTSFIRGPFHLGRYSAFIGWTSIVYITLSAVNFSLPPTYPVTLAGFNFTPLAVGLVCGGCILTWWLPKYGARYWYLGPKLAVEHAATERARALKYKSLKSSKSKSKKVPVRSLAECESFDSFDHRRSPALHQT
ncbi:hypothetical protein WJX73_003093 [Symbiochloris irregularis]|uniref:Amino acid transporter n=1 Tax=Symbiochloris irregularis TaxID=706552 RepID=A0AAW1PLW8_9CHLO